MPARPAHCRPTRPRLNRTEAEDEVNKFKCKGHYGNINAASDLRRRRSGAAQVKANILVVQQPHMALQI
jgi:hypothetical protein